MANTHRAAKRRHKLAPGIRNARPGKGVCVFAAKRRHKVAPGVSPGTHVVLRSSPIGAKDSVACIAPPALCFQARKDPGLTRGAVFSRRSAAPIGSNFASIRLQAETAG